MQKIIFEAKQNKNKIPGKVSNEKKLPRESLNDPEVAKANSSHPGYILHKSTGQIVGFDTMAIIWKLTNMNEHPDRKIICNPNQFY